MPDNKTVQLAISTIRTVSIDAVQAALHRLNLPRGQDIA
jgi:hypothetical protein